MDGDGDFDMVLGNDSTFSAVPQNRLYLNDGTGSFVDATAARIPVDTDETEALALGDVDRDGDLDIIFGNAGQDRLYLNDGSGSFIDVTAAHLPADQDFTNAVALGDVDGDGDLDIVFANGFRPQQNRLYLNDGSGSFIDATSTRMPADNDATWAVALGDVDGDGDLDIVLGNIPDALTREGGQDRLYLNDGTGVFVDASLARLPTISDWTTAVALEDVNGDGDLDFIVGNLQQRNRLHLNNGTGSFLDVFRTRMPFGLAVGPGMLGDVDRDGDLDMVLVRALCLNDGTGFFRDVTAARLPTSKHTTRSLALGDVDGDGDLDIVFGNEGQNELYLNDGSGAFLDATAARMPADGDFTNDVALADVDGDGDLDLVLANGSFSGQQNRLYLNDGTGTFTDATAVRMPIERQWTNAVTTGDVDLDGDLDLVFGNARNPYSSGSAQNRLYLNDGAGMFIDATAGHMPPDSDHTTDVVLGDVDRDGDLDIVLANFKYFSCCGRPQNRLYLNNGNGSFLDVTAARIPADNDDTNEVALGDVDGDGDLDLVLANYPQNPSAYPAQGGQNRLYLNDGTGFFVDATSSRMPVLNDATTGVILGDVDRDGDLDICFGNRQSKLYLNLQRQLDTPVPARVGLPYQLDAYARFGPRVQTVAGLFLSTGTGNLSLPPFGTFRLDPSQLLALPPFAIPPDPGVGSVSFPIPNVPSLAGVALYAQALLIQAPAAYLTGFTADEVFR